jgi:hypothetical protein
LHIDIEPMNSGIPCNISVMVHCCVSLLLFVDRQHRIRFSFWGSASCCTRFIKVIRKNRLSQQLFKVFIVFYTSTATCFGLHWPSSGGVHYIIYKEAIIPTTDPLSIVQIVLCTLFDKCCHRLSKCDCEVSNRACNHFVFNIRCWNYF